MTKNLSKQICEICGIKDNVDFFEPENFCKLIELPIKFNNANGEYDHTSSVVSYISFINEYKWDNREEFLEAILKSLDEDKNYYFMGYKSFTKAIREAEWKYE